jgi:tyrosyl-DNA phosphodiesterase-1
MNPPEVPAKRRKLNAIEDTQTEDVAIEELEATESLKRPISPPLSRRRRSLTPEVETPRVRALDEKHMPTATAIPEQTLATATTVPILAMPGVDGGDACAGGTERFMSSPVQLTRIRDLSKEQNGDAVRLEDILGDVMIKECWNFNFLFDIDWVM